MWDACISCALVRNAETFARTEWRQLRHRFKSGRISHLHSRVLGKDRAGALVDLHTHTHTISALRSHCVVWRLLVSGRVCSSEYEA